MAEPIFELEDPPGIQVFQKFKSLEDIEAVSRDRIGRTGAVQSGSLAFPSFAPRPLRCAALCMQRLPGLRQV